MYIELIYNGFDLFKRYDGVFYISINKSRTTKRFNDNYYRTAVVMIKSF